MCVRNIWADATCFEELLPCGRGAAAAQFLLTHFLPAPAEPPRMGVRDIWADATCFERASSLRARRSRCPVAVGCLPEH